MTYSKDQRVRISLDNTYGKILSQSEFIGSTGSFYWVQTENDVSLFSEEKLDELNQFGSCTCGGKVTKQPACSYWCDSLSIT